MNFLSLGHARAVRDRFAEWAKEYASEKEIDSICRAEGDWKKAIEKLSEKAARQWCGDGIPDWRYLGEMKEAIQFIAEQERAAILK